MLCKPKPCFKGVGVGAGEDEEEEKKYLGKRVNGQPCSGEVCLIFEKGLMDNHVLERFA